MDGLVRTTLSVLINTYKHENKTPYSGSFEYSFPDSVLFRRAYRGINIPDALALALTITITIVLTLAISTA